MKYLGIVLLALGAALGTAGWFLGCASLFSWNGRHALAVYPLAEGETLHGTIAAESRRRYTLAVQVVFDREGLVERDGSLVVDAKFPLVAKIQDDTGTPVVKLADWLDPSTQPSVLYGQFHGAEVQHAPGAPPPELFLERLVGPWPSATRAPLTFDVNLGADRVGMARIVERRVIVYDDGFLPSMKVGFGLFGAGILAFVSGLGIVVLRSIGRLLSRRSGIRGRKRA